MWDTYAAPHCDHDLQTDRFARMAPHRVELSIPAGVPIGNVDVVTEVRQGDVLLGRLSISRGGIDWTPARKRNPISVKWKRFSEIMADEAS
jgi:hypothetical protein